MYRKLGTATALALALAAPLAPLASSAASAERPPPVPIKGQPVEEIKSDVVKDLVTAIADVQARKVLHDTLIKDGQADLTTLFADTKGSKGADFFNRQVEKADHDVKQAKGLGRDARLGAVDPPGQPGDQGQAQARSGRQQHPARRVVVERREGREGRRVRLERPQARARRVHPADRPGGAGGARQREDHAGRHGGGQRRAGEGRCQQRGDQAGSGGRPGGDVPEGALPRPRSSPGWTGSR